MKRIMRFSTWGIPSNERNMKTFVDKIVHNICGHTLNTTCHGVEISTNKKHIIVTTHGSILRIEISDVNQETIWITKCVLIGFTKRNTINNPSKNIIQSRESYIEWVLQNKEALKLAKNDFKEMKKDGSVIDCY